MPEAFAAISVALVLAAMPPYIIDTLHHKTKPERATWFILSVLGLIAFGSQVKLGASWSLLFSGMDTLGSLSVFALSIRFGVGGFTRLDRLALFIAGVGLAIALLANRPIIALFGVLLADFSGTGLTAIKAYKQPSTETTVSWLLVGTAGLFGVLSISKLTFGILLYPLYLVLANYAIPVAQFISPHRRAQLARKTR